MADQDFLGGMIADEEPAVAEPEVVQPAETVVEEPVQPEPTPEPEPVPEPQPEPEAPKEDQRVPLATFLDKRDEARELKRRLEAYEAREREQQRPVIDPFDDPEGFAAHQQQLVEQRLTQERFAFSDRFARKEHGAEAVDAAVTWAQQRAQADPAFAMSYMREADPVDWIVQQHKRDSMISQIGNRSMDDFVRDYLAQNPGLVAQPAPVAAAPVAAVVQPAAKPTPPPRSIASERTDASRVSPEGERDGFLASIVGK
jgi:hypothetical protein